MLAGSSYLEFKKFQKTIFNSSEKKTFFKKYLIKYIYEK